MKSFSHALLATASIVVLATGNICSAEPSWTIAQTGRDFSYNTATGMVTTKGVTGIGLMGVSRSGEHEVRTVWQEGAFGPTMTFNGRIVTNGLDPNSVSRITGFRFDRTGAYVFLKTGKGPTARVELVFNGRVVHAWPRLSIVRILSFADREAVVSVYDDEGQRTQFFRLSGFSSVDVPLQIVSIGYVEACAVLGSKVLDTGIALQMYCDAGQGSDLTFLSFQSGQLTSVFVDERDHLLVSQLGRRAGAFSVLSIEGNDNARIGFHAIFGALMKDLGEPMSRASDAAGKQSWGQSYRTLVLSKLFEASGFRLFAELAASAMENTLSQTNVEIDVEGDNNPPCAWSSRIYSIDKREPISLLVNQAMISGSLLTSCSRMGDFCPTELSQEIIENTQCLVDHFEGDFDVEEGLYRIPYAAPFRYDGVVAPWNWQMRWSGVLDRLGRDTGQSELQARAESMRARFLGTWTQTDKGALWRYWTPTYYQGWRREDNVSQHREQQRADPNGRFEDLNHAGISLLGISEMQSGLDVEFERAVVGRLDHLLSGETVLARGMDGGGPKSPRWMPGAGWDLVAGDRMLSLYTHVLPGGVSSDQHLSYATLYDADKPFDLVLTHSFCQTNGECVTEREWRYDNLSEFLNDNPLFQVSENE